MGETLLFSYASAEDPALRRIAIRTIERLTGQPRLKRMYLENQRHRRLGETFWDAAVRQLELQVDCDEARLRALPAVGPVVVVANHPFGVLDGIVIGYLVGKVRPDFKVLTHSLLCRVAELKPYLLPIDFGASVRCHGDQPALPRRSVSWLGNGVLVVFPGAVSTSKQLLGGRAVDPEWKLFTAKAITRAQATVLPMFFEGQNSRLFQVASHISLTLRLSLLLNELRNKIGSVVAVRIGAPVAHTELSHIADRKALADHVRRATYELAGDNDSGMSRSRPIGREGGSALLRTDFRAR